jgi:hypothetical protein
MECDSVHAAIEATARNIDVYTPLQWETVIRVARASNPDRVVNVDHTFWKKYIATVTSIRPGKRAAEPTVTDLRHIVYMKDGSVLYSLSHGTPQRPLQCKMMKTKAAADTEPKPKYSSSLSVASKLTDLLELSRLIVPAEHQPFFNNLK